MRISMYLTGLGLVSTLALAGCAETRSRPAVDTVADARAHLPSNLVAPGVLTLGSDLGYEPMEYVENGKQVGFEVELVQAVADTLGLRLNLVQTSWDDLRKAVTEGRIDGAVSSMTDTAERQREVDFVDYLNVGSSLVVRKDVVGVTDFASVCGHRLAVSSGTIYEELVTEQAKSCPLGRPLRTLVVDDVDAQVNAGHADGYIDDFPVAVLAAKRNPNLQVVGQQIEAAPYGLAVKKGNKALAKALQLALFELFHNGAYDRLLTKWHITEGALKTGAINGGA
jgi:polar amino acid transport system substrate-binding protein